MQDRRGQRRHTWGALFLVALVLVWLSGALAPSIDGLLQASAEILRGHALLGKLLFTLLAIASPMLAFFSSAVLVPAATAAWGPVTTFLLLWLGWIGGGVTAYSIARFLGRAVVHRFAPGEKLSYYEERVGQEGRWWMLLLLQLALPSELPGYLAGILRVRFSWYLGALALGELPYAIGTVTLGEAFVERNPLVFVAVLVGGIALLTVAFRVLHGQLERRRSRAPADA